MSEATPKVVSLDLDDVLVDFLPRYLVRLNEVAGTSFVEDDIVDTDWAECRDREGGQATLAHALEALERMVTSGDVLDLPLRSGAADGLDALARAGIDVLINTHRAYWQLPPAVNARFARDTHVYLARVFPKGLSAVAIVGTAQEKLEACIEHGATIHCDDRATNLAPMMQDRRVRGVLLDRLWNRRVEASAIDDDADVLPVAATVRVTGLASMFRLLERAAR